MLSLVEEYKSPKSICVIGDLMLDHYIYGRCSRISPEAPVPVVEYEREYHTLGGAGNVVKNVNSLGPIANLISVIGDDENGRRIINDLQNYDVSPKSIITDSSRPTTTKSRIVVSNHQMLRLDYESSIAINNNIEAQLLTSFKQCVINSSIVLVSDYKKGLLTPTLLNGIFETAHKAGLQTIVDPKGSDFSKYKGATIIKPNKKEASVATGINIIDEKSLKAACENIKQTTHCKYVIVTMSEEGIAIYSDEGLSVIATKALAIVDVTGAGDTVLAALGVALAIGKSIFEACEFANHAAAVVISKTGSATVTLDEIQQNYLSWKNE